MGSQTHIGGDRSRTNWTTAMERYFIDLMLDQVHRGNRMGHTFNKQAWNDMLVMFNSSFGSPYDVNVLKSRYTSLWKQFSDVKNLLDQNGFSWDSTRQMVVAERYVWDAYIKAHPDAQYYRNKALLNFNDLCLIYAHTTADGRYSLSSHDVDFDDDFQSLNVVVGVNNLVAATKERPKTDWTLAMDRYFIKLMMDQLRKGSKVNDSFRKQAWIDMLNLFNVKFDSQYGEKVLRRRYKKLFKYYTNLRSLLDENGFFWDGRQQRIVAEDVVWDNYIKAHPDAHSYRKKSLLNYHDLSLIYGTAISNGVHCQRGEEREGPSFDSEDFDNEDPDLIIDGEEIQSDVNDDSSSVDWTPSMDRCLIDIMLEQVHKMNKIDCSIDGQAWIDMVVLFKDRFGWQHDKEILRSRAKMLEQQYLDMKDLLDHRGFWWDEVQQMITACDYVWDAYIEDNPGAESYRFESKPNYNDLCLIYGSSTSNGQFNQSCQYISCNGAECPFLKEYAFLSINRFEFEGAKVYNSYHGRTDWTPQMDRYFVDLMLEQVRNGSMVNQKFSKLAWTEMVAKFSAEFGSQHDKDVLKSRFLNLRKRFNDMKALLDQRGFAWDEMHQRVTADDDLWDAYVKEYPDARSYRNRTLPNFNDLFLIYGNTNNIREEDYSSHSMASEDVDAEVNIGDEDDQSPANFYPPREPTDAMAYEDGIMDGFEELFTFDNEFSNGGENLNIKREFENDTLAAEMDDIFCDLQSPAREFEISDRRKKRKLATSSKPSCSRKVQRNIKEEIEETFEEKPGSRIWYAGCVEENDNCSIERVVAALETVPDMSDELFLEACKLLEDEREAKMFVAMDATARKKWLLRKLSR